MTGCELVHFIANWCERTIGGQLVRQFQFTCDCEIVIAFLSPVFSDNFFEIWMLPHFPLLCRQVFEWWVLHPNVCKIVLRVGGDSRGKVAVALFRIREIIVVNLTCRLIRLHQYPSIMAIQKAAWGLV